jgi:hypothetical protein
LILEQICLKINYMYGMYGLTYQCDGDSYKCNSFSRLNVNQWILIYYCVNFPDEKANEV